MYIYRMEFKNPFSTAHIESVDLVRISTYWETEEHIRPVWKLYWNNNSGASLSFLNQSIPLQPESLYLISPMTSYTPRCRGEVEHLYIHFKLPGEYGKLPQGIWKIPPGKYIYSQLKEAWQKGFKTFHHRLLYQELITYSLRQLPESFFEQSHPNPLSMVYIWLEKNLDKDCSNSVLAAIAGYSEDTLNRVFLKETGKTPQNYVRNHRISRAANLLRQRDLSMEEIAEFCGFYDRSHFHKSFQKRVGVSPVEYRSKVQKL